MPLQPPSLSSHSSSLGFRFLFLSSLTICQSTSHPYCYQSLPYKPIPLFPSWESLYFREHTWSDHWKVSRMTKSTTTLKINIRLKKKKSIPAVDLIMVLEHGSTPSGTCQRQRQVTRWNQCRKQVGVNMKLLRNTSLYIYFFLFFFFFKPLTDLIAILMCKILSLRQNTFSPTRKHPL